MAKKAVKKVSQATLTRRRNKMFGTKTKELEAEIEKWRKLSIKKEEEISDLQRSHRRDKEDWDRERIRLSEVEHTLKKKFDEEKALAFKTMELEFKGKMQEEVNRVRNEAQDKIQKGIEENFNKLKDSLAKLHEEGNAQTKFTEQIALKMMGALAPAVKPPAIEG